MLYNIEILFKDKTKIAFQRKFGRKCKTQKSILKQMDRLTHIVCEEFRDQYIRITYSPVY